ncbi:MAG: hypothetical protein ABI629_12445 [bacterium]
MAEINATPLDKLRIIWIAFFAAVCVYALVPWFALRDGLDAAAPNTEAMRLGLQAGAIGAAMASFLTRRRWSKLIVAAAQPGAAPGPDVLTLLQTGCIVTWLISEVVALVGLAVALVTRHAVEVVPYAAAALFLLYMHRLALWPLPPPASGASDGA